MFYFPFNLNIFLIKCLFSGKNKTLYLHVILPLTVCVALLVVELSLDSDVFVATPPAKGGD